MNSPRRSLFPTLLLAAALAAVACGGKEGETDAAPEKKGILEIATSFHPAAYLAGRIAGDRARVTCPLPADADPAFWAPDDASLGSFRSADLIVVNGAEFEKWVPTVSLPESRIFALAASSKDAFVRYEHAFTHSHGGGGEHSHVGTDGHTWLDPVIARAGAEGLRDRLIALDPDGAPTFRENCAALVADLNALDAELRALSEGEAAWWYASHPAYNYPAKRYGWKVVNLDLDPEEVPSAETLAAAKAKGEGHGPFRYIVWEGEPLPEVVAAVKEALGVESVVASPAEALAAEELAAGENYLAIMRRNLEVFRRVVVTR
ncbi:MAG: metal ABC transporter substrate-binding protein [Planctomycetota bacterium]